MVRQLKRLVLGLKVYTEAINILFLPGKKLIMFVLFVGNLMYKYYVCTENKQK